jgi:hypothetical protein
LLPDDVSIWSTDSGVSYEKRFAPEYEPGYLVYSGAQNDISSLVTITNTGTLFNLSLPVYFPIETIKELVITVLDDTSTFVYDVVIPLTGIVDDTRMGRMTFADSSGEALSMEATLTRDNLDVLSLSLNVTQLALPLVDGVASPKTDIVRYVRARV